MKKNTAIIILLAVIIALAVALAYLSLRRPAQSPTPANPQNANVAQVPAPQNPPLPSTCTEKEGGAPVITSLSASSGPIGTRLEIRGCNFSGFEGDKNVWMENTKGVKGILYGEEGSTDQLIIVTVKTPLCEQDLSYKGGECDTPFNLTPGVYSIFTFPWGVMSNSATFTLE